MSNIAVRVENLSKQYQLGGKQAAYQTFRETLIETAYAPLRWLRGERRPTEKFWALDDVSFEIKHGEAVGIIGRNGAGKSTLLKILSSITHPTRGRVELYGRVGSLLEVGTGFHPELTGRENIFLNGAILGMSHSEITRKFDEIVDFAEVEKFLDTPVKFYSSGMYVRLAFAVAAHLEPEILIVDEVLAVGDAEFQKKCLGKMGDVTHAGRTVLFVSHNMNTISSLCSRAILLSKGQIVADGEANVVIKKYLRENFDTIASIIDFEDDQTLRLQFTRVELQEAVDGQGSEVLNIFFTFRARTVLATTMICVEVRTLSDVCVFYSNDDLLQDVNKRELGIHTEVITIPKYLFAPGDYYITFGLWEPGRSPEHFPQERLFFRREEPVNRLSAHGIQWPGLIYLPGTWSTQD